MFTPDSLGLTFAIAWLILIFVLALGYLLVQYRRSEYSLWENCLYAPTYLLGRLQWRVHFQNQPPPEIRSGAILVANHRSSVDPFFVQLAARRRVHWMVAKEFCKHFVFGILLRALQVIPTNRSGMDTAATKTAMRLTGEGRLVGMFPEGKINRTPKLLLPVRSGAAVVANHAKVPMIPLLIEGSPMREAVWSPAIMSAHVKITFGQPIVIEEPADSDGSDQTELSPCDQAMLRWGQQISNLARQPSYRVQLAAARARRNRNGRS